MDAPLTPPPPGPILPPLTPTHSYNIKPTSGRLNKTVGIIYTAYK